MKRAQNRTSDSTPSSGPAPAPAQHAPASSGHGNAASQDAVQGRLAKFNGSQERVLEPNIGADVLMAPPTWEFGGSEDGGLARWSLPEAQAATPWLDAAVSEPAADILSDELAPHLDLTGTDTPHPGVLYELADRNQPGAESAEPFSLTRGTVETPVERPRLQDDALYLTAGPKAGDIEQYSIGDCYFLAMLASVVRNDPGMIEKNLKLSGNTVSFPFYVMLDPVEWEFRREVITTSTDLAFFQRASDDAQGLPVGAQYIVGDQPEVAEWWAAVENDTLTVVRSAEHRAALWVPYLEKLYGIFSQLYDQYGAAVDAESDSKSRFNEKGEPQDFRDMLNGGHDKLALLPFYGDQLTIVRHDMVSFDPAAAGKEAEQNPRLIRALAGGTDAQRQTRPNDGSDGGFFLAAGADDTTHVQNFRTQLAAVMALPESQNESNLALVSGLKKLDALASQWIELNRKGDRTALRGVGDQMSHLSATLTKPDVHAAFSEDSVTGHWRAMLELTTNLTTLGVDQSEGRRNVYSGHSYSVQHVEFQDAEGNVLAVTPQTSGDALSKISSENSRITLYNPHRRNEPDLHGRGPQDERVDGKFELTLAQFVRNFTAVGYGTTQNMGPAD